MALPTSGLVLDLQAGVGVTSSGGRVSTWADQSGAGNDAAQATGANQPIDTTDDDGAPVVRFQYGLSDTPADVAMHMTLPSGLVISATNVWTTLLVMKPVAPLGGSTSQHVPIHFTGWGFSPLFFTVNSNYVPFMTSGNKAPVPRLHAATVKNIYGIRARTGDVDFVRGWVPGVVSAGSAHGVTSTAGGVLGANATPANYFFGDMYRVLVWNRSLSDTELQDARDYLVATYELRTEYRQSVVCVGDSITLGTRTTNNRMYPFHAFGPDWLVFICGLGGVRIGRTTADSSTLRAIRANAIDDSWVTGIPRQVLAVMAGTNDIGFTTEPATAANAWIYLKALIAEAKAVHPWESWAITIPDRSSSGAYPAVVAAYNALIRAANAHTDGVDLVIDPGAGGDSPANRLGNGDDTTYFYTDKIHPNNAGTAVITDAVSAKANYWPPGRGPLNLRTRHRRTATNHIRSRIR